MKRIGWLAIAGVLGVIATSAAWAQAPKLEKTRISLSVGLSAMAVAVVMAPLSDSVCAYGCQV